MNDSIMHPAARPGVSASGAGADVQKSPPIIADVHAHTSYSHGQAGTLDMARAARKTGLRIFGFSEHSPRPPEYIYPEDYQDSLREHLPDYVAEVQRLAEEAEAAGPQEMRILLGIELDYFPGREDFAKELARSYPFDYIIGGLHFQGTWGFDFTPADWEDLDQKKRFAVYARYYRDMEAMCASGIYHVAAHPDIIKLFSKDSFDAWLKTAEADERIRAALAAMRDNGVLMEVSSAGLRKPCNEIYPGPRVMALARDIGVDISFGSDAHCTNTPAYAFDSLARYAHAFGYTESFIVAAGKRQNIPFTPPEPL